MKKAASDAYWITCAYPKNHIAYLAHSVITKQLLKIVLHKRHHYAGYYCGWIGPIGVYKSCPECKSHFSLVRAGKREGAKALVAYRILGLTGKAENKPSVGRLMRSSTLPELKSALKVIEKTGE